MRAGDWRSTRAHSSTPRPWQAVATPFSPSPTRATASVEFNHDAIAIVERVSDQLKTSVYSREIVIFGLVTHLNRHPDDETRRVGV